jgi:hypothetical protein
MECPAESRFTGDIFSRLAIEAEFGNDRGRQPLLKELDVLTDGARPEHHALACLLPVCDQP